ncbi:MAG: hypothetical protein PF518_10975 [Spirochaetaceae bacterium]|jgi:hypothetical protein|nr:hypothetical protein [Spirochaetaceae bacterium]
MQIENSSIQINNPQLEQLLVDAQTQGTELAEKIIKMNALQQIDQSQLAYMGNIINLYV